MDPTISFRRMTFSDGTTIDLEPNDVVVFVGPNNAGKSLALREIDQHIGDPRATLVVKEVEKTVHGTSDEFEVFLRKHARITNRDGSLNVSAYGVSLQTGASDIKQHWPNQASLFKSLFCMLVRTEGRITDSDPVDSIAVPDDPVSHPIHMLLNDAIEEKMSGYFRKAFGEDLILFRTGGKHMPLLVGHRLRPAQGEDRVSHTYCKRLLDSTVPLQKQGDGMRSFASVILHVLAPITPSVLLLDEPEAFLHPPQARLLGEIIAREKSPRSQLFLATHSPDVLDGLIGLTPKNLRVVRMHRDGSINRIKELDKALVRKISVDPLMKYSSVMSGVFHERVIICESDTDCMFYGAILDLPGVYKGRHPDVLFVHAGGKDRMATLAQTLVVLDVTVDIVADIDILREEAKFRLVVESLGGDWSEMQSRSQIVRSAVNQQKPILGDVEVRENIRQVLDDSLDQDTLTTLRSRINDVFRKASPWDALKRSGASGLPAGDATQRFKELKDLCNRIGLWIVPVGEVEGFCKSVGNHGPKWVQRVMGSKNLSRDPELKDARCFVREIWQRKSTNEAAK